MWRRTGLNLRLCYQIAEAAIENDPDNLWIFGPEYYADQEMSHWD